MSDIEKKEATENIDDKSISGSEAESREASTTEPAKKKFKPSYHLILAAIILLIAAVSIYKLVKWDQGTEIEMEVDPDFDTSQFDIESMDMIIPMDASRLEGRADDGVTTILCLGNNPFSDDRSDNGLASLIGAKANATVFDCSFPDSTIACKYSMYDPSYTKDQFNLFYVVECFRNNQFTAINSIANDEPDPRYMEAVNVMKEVDMDKVDVIVLMYDSTDYNMLSPADNPDNPYDVSAYTGGLRMSLKNIEETWPHIRVFVMSHTYAQYRDEDGKLHNGATKDLGNGSLNHYLIKESDAAMDSSVSFIDNYYGTINEDNYKEYMKDHMKYNTAGREALADRIAEIINTRMGTVNSTTGN